jgi:hypothetical protein
MADLSKKREVIEGFQYQGVDESIAYAITSTPWASSPSISTVVVKRLSDGSDVSATVMPAGSNTVSGDVMTLKPLTALTAEEKYKVEVKFTAEGNTLECYFFVQAEV